jgi:hypothetical protein
MSAEIEGDFVVFMIGMRINRLWKLHKWLPVFSAMPRMLKELEKQPQSGFLGSVSGGMLIVQYWRSFEHLEAYARSQDHHHWPAWVAFNKRMRESRGDVGIWHETYLVRAGEYEAISLAACRPGVSAAPPPLSQLPAAKRPPATASGTMRPAPLRVQRASEPAATPASWTRRPV